MMSEPHGFSVFGGKRLEKLFDAENSFAGRSSFEGKDLDRWLSLAAISVATFYFVFKFINEMDMPLDERVTSTDRMIYVLGVSSVGAFGA